MDKVLVKQDPCFFNQKHCHILDKDRQLLLTPRGGRIKKFIWSTMGEVGSTADQQNKKQSHYYKFLDFSIFIFLHFLIFQIFDFFSF